MIYPKIYLALDNCFCSKRWNSPDQWSEIIKSTGINYVELSADNDCDPLFMGDDYLKKWVGEVAENCAKYDLTISSMYSGHGTYSTLGLGHPDKSVRSIMKNRWLKPMMYNAATLNTGLGFYCHAFNQQILQNKAVYDNACNILYEELSDLTQYAAYIQLKFLALEQMYSPHQIPWTIKGCMDIMQNVVHGLPLYITLDTGHQSIQSQFLMPAEQELLYSLKNNKHIWLGSNNAYDIFQSRKRDNIKLKEIIDDIQKHPWLFASEDDIDYIKWFERLACYSPIIHLQQCQKNSSPHLPFTDTYNESGIIKPIEILSAIKRCYDNQSENDMSDPVSEIYLTLEIFFPTAAKSYDIIKNMNDSVKYWRKFIPEDGLYVNEILDTHLHNKNPIYNKTKIKNKYVD